MKERYTETAGELIDPEHQRLLEMFENPKIPLKIRKNELLKESGLPTPEAIYFAKSDITEVESQIDKSLEAEPDRPFVLRVACIPDKLSMPIFYMEKPGDFTKQFGSIQLLLTTEPTITQFILQHATPRNEAVNKISGRFLLSGDKLFPTEEVLELYKGSRSTSVLNKTEINDPNFVRFEKKAGGFLKPVEPIDFSQTQITSSDLAAISQKLAEYRKGIDLAAGVFVENKKKLNKGDEACFEFSYRDGNIDFTDID